MPLFQQQKRHTQTNKKTYYKCHSFNNKKGTHTNKQKTNPDLNDLWKSYTFVKSAGFLFVCFLTKTFEKIVLILIKNELSSISRLEFYSLLTRRTTAQRMLCWVYLTLCLDTSFPDCSAEVLLFVRWTIQKGSRRLVMLEANKSLTGLMLVYVFYVSLCQDWFCVFFDNLWFDDLRAE